MSIETWKNEFYPVSARQAAGSTLKALEHSLRKWEGLRKMNLKKHGLISMHCSAEIFEKDSSAHFNITTTTCALCERFFASPSHRESCCKGCPLSIRKGAFGCGKDSAYDMWTLTGNPTRMINKLRKAIAAEKARLNAR